MRVDLDQTLSALAAPARRGIVDLLREGPRSASELADALVLPRPALSKHLRVLREAGVVEQEGIESDGRVRMVQLRREPFEALRDWVADVEGFWTAQLDAFAKHAEQKHGKGRR